jgi:hypothetical protein
MCSGWSVSGAPCATKARRRTLANLRAICPPGGSGIVATAVGEGEAEMLSRACAREPNGTWAICLEGASVAQGLGYDRLAEGARHVRLQALAFQRRHPPGGKATGAVRRPSWSWSDLTDVTPCRLGSGSHHDHVPNGRMIHILNEEREIALHGKGRNPSPTPTSLADCVPRSTN